MIAVQGGRSGLKTGGGVQQRRWTTKVVGVQWRWGRSMSATMADCEATQTQQSNEGGGGLTRMAKCDDNKDDDDGKVRRRRRRRRRDDNNDDDDDDGNGATGDGI